MYFSDIIILESSDYMRYVGTVVRGIRTPIIKENDNLVDIVVDSLIKASDSERFNFKDKDIVAITESVVAISEGNYVSVDDIANDLQNKFSKKIGIVYPILSRNRFSIILKSIARAMDEITLLLSFPSDEVGNGILNEELLEKSGFNLNDVITEDDYENNFSSFIHPFTGINMIKFYRELASSENCKVKFVFSNNPKTILEYNKEVLVCDIHSRFKTKEALIKAGAEKVLALNDIMNASINGSGYNELYGLLGSNKSTEERVKLFPRSSKEIVLNIQKKLKEKTGKNIEVMVYGDGAFKDPVGHIWELADPVVSPAYTEGLEGTPNELKLKYISDNKYSNLKGEELMNAVKNEIKEKDNDLKGNMLSQGTTPRRYVDLIGTLCDLTSGSGDKCTPVIYIQGYFDNITNE